ncbi:uncharacterized protein LOC62_03G003753 [Vanrija pseudolonga]|uniref:Uncharacterized protein n=1 Tax=Vanrija pseudolonga TaxID=143232 RepID=A0AAF0Y595_9TREE|nr:hypothetical protein LOC62_03G003753 [Vanrija pseudolonga]
MVTAVSGPRPGLGLDIKTYTQEGQRQKVFPLALLGDWALNPAPTLRERAMLTFMNNVTDMPGWDDKVLSDEGVRELEVEQLELAGLVERENHGERRSGGFQEKAQASLPEDSCGFSAAMFEACIAELQHKARDFKYTDIVGVLDVNAAILKKDTSEEFRLSIAESLKGVEKEALDHAIKNWQPNHNETLLKVVQPVLYPLLFGRTRVLTDRELGLADCLDAVGSGRVIDSVMPIPCEDGDHYSNQLGGAVRSEDAAYWTELSRKNQWLPAEVAVDAEGKAHITSYINNLHPVAHADVYHTVERILDQALPMFSATYNSVRTSPADHVRFSIADLAKLERACDTPDLCASRGGCKPENWTHGPGEGEVEPWFTGEPKTTEWFARTHRVSQPEPITGPQKSSYVGAEYFTTSPPWTTVEDEGRTNKLQIFVTVGNILLTPEKPKYETGQFHVEGLVNERICASAIYYYDSDNITESRLLFDGAAVSDQIHCGGDGGKCRNLYDLYVQRLCGDPPSITVGSVESRPGRLVVFPNVFAHRVEPFELKDKGRPGYRKVVGIFLVDPKTPIISTANVPPQQLHWALDDSPLNVVDTKLPPEISTLVYEDLGCPYNLQEAHKISNDSMEYRSHRLKSLPYRGHMTVD